MVYAYTDEESGLYKGHVAGPRPTGACGDWKNRSIEWHDGRLGKQVKLGIVVDNVHSHRVEIVSVVMIREKWNPRRHEIELRMFLPL